MDAIARSLLFVPGNRPDRFEKACAACAGAVIIDLEDAVPAAGKSQARRAVEAWLSPAHPVIVRVNGVGTDWFRDDLTCCRRPGVQAVMLPKAESVEHLSRVEDGLGQISVLPLIETARGFAAALDIARHGAVDRLVFGSLDFQIDLGIPGDQLELLYFRSQLVLISRLANIEPPVDGITTAFDNPEEVAADALRARRTGFGGKLCIHPKQVPIVNDCFRPTAEEISWAQRVLDAAAASNGAAVALHGQMIDRPVILKAQRILDEAGRQDKFS